MMKIMLSIYLLYMIDQKKSADWNYIDECAKLSNLIPLSDVSDIYSFEDYYQRSNETNVNGCMIAQDALIKLWLFAEIHEQRT